MPTHEHPADRLSPGSIIHIENYQGYGYEPANKFLIILGSSHPNTLLAFVITSQSHYLESYRAKELVEIPPATVSCLPKRSWIKCFELQRLDFAKLVADMGSGAVRRTGDLRSFLAKVRGIVELSEALSQQEIDEMLLVLPE